MSKGRRYKKKCRGFWSKKTRGNKICSIILAIIGIISTILTNDATFLLFILAIAIPLLFAKENYIWDYEDEL